MLTIEHYQGSPDSLAGKESACKAGDPGLILKHHSSKALILRLSAIIIVQLSHPYMTTEKL